MAVDLKSATPDTSLPKTGFLFGADSQAAAAPSVFSVAAVAERLLGGTALSGDTVTTSKPLADFTQTWNASGVQFTAWRVNITDTASYSTSLFMDFQVGGTSRYRVDKSGTMTLSGSINVFSNAVVYGNVALLDNASALTLGASQDVILKRDAANALAQRNGANAQTQNIYNTYTDASNYERVNIGWSSNVAYLRPQNAGTGSARLLVYQSGSTTVASLPSASTAGAGARSFVTDASATTFLSTVAGGGANKVPVVSDGTNWLIG